MYELLVISDIKGLEKVKKIGVPYEIIERYPFASYEIVINVNILTEEQEERLKKEFHINEDLDKYSAIKIQNFLI